MPNSNKILKPSNDKCNYFTFQLENKLNVFLVEDSDTDMACGTMLVKIGHDHDTVIGIAHFLEHMLFNGTEKYPNENEYSSYIHKNGGMQNAYTDHDHTCYFFTIQPQCLEHSLDMFGNFFISPLLNSDTIDREKNAVNSEHVKNINNDSWRLQEIVRQAMNKKNPLSVFGTGSDKTLNIPDIDKKVRDFFEKYYSSHLMTLFVITKDSVELIKSKIIEIFSQIPLKQTSLSTSSNQKIYDYPKTLQVVPLKEMENLSISWDLPSYKNCVLQSPYHFLSHLIGHEGKNTIHHLLSQLGYITNLFAGTEIHANDRCTFTVKVTLTPSGAKCRENILFTIIKYIELIKHNINHTHLKRLYDEQMTLDAFEFKYSIKNDPSDRTLEYVRLVNNYDFDLHNMLIIPYAKENFEPHVKSNLEYVLNEMTCSKSVVIFVSNSYNGKTTCIDEDYGTNYNILNEYPNLDNVDIDISLLDLPCENRFISIDENIITTNQKIPSKIQNDSNSNSNININLYYLPTCYFETPDVCIKTTIFLPLSMNTVEMYIKTTLYFSSLLAEINNENYMCTTANYNVNVYFDNGKLEIEIFGNHGKIKDVCSFLIDSLLNKNLITEKIFNTVIYDFKTMIKNAILTSPYIRVGEYFKKAICTQFYNDHDILPVLERNDDILSIESVKSVIDEILETSCCTLFVSGNCTSDLTNDIASIFNKFIKNNCGEFTDTYLIPPPNMEPILKNAENSVEINTVISYNIFIDKVIYGKTENWAKNVCILNILDSVISTEYFDQLRTKDAFGYIVNSSKRTFGNTSNKSKYYGFLVQSPHKSSTEIIERTNRFIIEYQNKINSFEDKDLNEIVDALVSQLNSPFNNLQEMTNYIYSNEIIIDFSTFDLKKQLIDMYKNITVADLIQFYDDKFIKNKRVVVVGLLGHK